MESVMTPKEARKIIRLKLEELHAAQREDQKILHQPHTEATALIMQQASWRAVLITGWSNKLNELCGRKPCHGANPDMLRWWGHDSAQQLRNLVIETQPVA
jgi:hypothetical protein